MQPRQNGLSSVLISIQRLLLLLIVASFLSTQSLAQAMEAPADAPNSPNRNAAPIQDNSFLIEEAYNQEDGVIQHISAVQRSFQGGDWVYTQTEEWPLRTLKHQISATFSALSPGGLPYSFGWGDTGINYRYQLKGNGESRVAIAPRLTVLIPTGNSRLGRGLGSTGFQTNIPMSVQHNSHLVTHWNAGLTLVPDARNNSGDRATLVNFNLGQSFVWLAAHRFNGMLETVWTSTQTVVGPGQRSRHQDIFVSPGVRWAYNFKSGLQIVPGIGVPLGAGPSSGQRALIFYLSFEHPLAFAHSR